MRSIHCTDDIKRRQQRISIRVSIFSRLKLALKSCKKIFTHRHNNKDARIVIDRTIIRLMLASLNDNEINLDSLIRCSTFRDEKLDGNEIFLTEKSTSKIKFLSAYIHISLDTSCTSMALAKPTE